MTFLALVFCSPAAAQAPNARPVVTGIAGAAAGSVGQQLSYTVNAFDRDGRIVSFAFDLDGDGRFEHEAGTSNVVAVTYASAGTRNLGVRVLDDRGAASYASIAVTIAAAPQPPALAPPALGVVSSFRAGRPVFGGTKRRRLKLRYSVRADARVTISLHRGERRIRRLARNRASAAGRTYRLALSPRRLRRGTYTLRLTASAADGRTQSATLTALRL